MIQMLEEKGVKRIGVPAGAHEWWAEQLHKAKQGRSA